MGYLYNLKVYMNQLQMFGEYKNNTISIKGKKMLKSDVGRYEIVFIGEFSKVVKETNGKYTDKFYRFTASLWITIYDDGDDDKIIEIIPDDYPEWNEEPKFDLIPAIVQNSTRPVPYIESLSDFGLLKIGWDQLMNPLSDYE